jgi:hypothetical protein
LKSDAIDVKSQLENMEFEIQDIVQHYEFNEIPGINGLPYFSILWAESIKEPTTMMSQTEKHNKGQIHFMKNKI